MVELGSDASAACGRTSELSAWQRSKFRERTANRKFRAPQQEDSLDLGFSIPIKIEYADVVELVDSLDLGSNAKACRFESCHPHHIECS